MNKELLFIPFICSLLTAQTVEPKVMHSTDKNYKKNYDNSANIENTEEQVISSTAEASAQITIMVTLQASSEMISGRHNSRARISFLDNNRIKITEEIAKGDGEHLKTLLSMMKLKKDKKSLIKLQTHFNELIYLNHHDFLDKLESLV